MSKKKSDLREEDFRKLAPLKKCPFCGEKLEKGYIHSDVYWDKKRRKFLSGVLTSQETLLGPSWTVPYAPALRCGECGIVIFDYAKDE